MGKRSKRQIASRQNLSKVSRSSETGQFSSASNIAAYNEDSGTSESEYEDEEEADSDDSSLNNPADNLSLINWR